MVLPFIPNQCELVLSVREPIERVPVLGARDTDLNLPVRYHLRSGHGCPIGGGQI